MKIYFKQLLQITTNPTFRLVEKNKKIMYKKNSTSTCQKHNVMVVVMIKYF